MVYGLFAVNREERGKGGEEYERDATNEEKRERRSERERESEVGKGDMSIEERSREGRERI